MEDILKVLEKSVLRLIDVDGKEINFKTCEIKLFKHKYSSSGRETVTMFIDGNPITGKKKTGKIKVEYKCSCSRINTICLSKFLSKKALTCSGCRENAEKIAWHRLYFEMRRNGLDRGHKKRETATYNFSTEADSFKRDYFRRNLTEEEFNVAINYIYSIDNIEIKGKNVQFLVAEPAKNAKKYSQYVLIDGEKHRLSDICLQCPLCGDIFHITRHLKERINSHNFDCRKCFLNNKTFAIKKYNNLTFQGKLEFCFIKECEQRKIKIENGAKVQYIFNGRKHIYTIDFYLPGLHSQIEIKDNHVWHRKQVESGKWAAKEAAARKYCKENSQTYHLLFKKDIITFFNNLERDSLNSIER